MKSHNNLSRTELSKLVLEADQAQMDLGSINISMDYHLKPEAEKKARELADKAILAIESTNYFTGADRQNAIAFLQLED